MSYETFRVHAPTFSAPGSCDLLICDEAHRLKNDATLTNRALAGLACKRRVLLSGTPMQNDLQEFFAMVDFTNTGILGDAGACACACGVLVARPCGRARAQPHRGGRTAAQPAR